MKRLALALTLALPAAFLSGCPQPAQQTARVGLVLESDCPDPALPVPLSKEVQLRLRFQPPSEHQLIGALIDDKPGAQTQWYVEPTDAAEIDPKTAVLRVRKAGKIKVWATYEEGGQKLESNALELTVAPGVAPLTSQSE
ncbi:MAG TPA: hypothetical protein DEA08_30280 [Planctomycetes bacterium]|nr:hypothetical protein [Planctomycetota bacterium]|tara:strand:+ start:128 stop:547 length:420 start_codon:yes stop_codon:yes gene_type:complete